MKPAAVESAHDITSSRRLFITVSVMLASIMQALDTTIANVALPRMQGSISATQDQMAWVLTAYIVTAAIMTPLSGWLAGQIGRKPVFLYSVVGFTTASMLCGLAQSLPEIIAARLLQGLCGAALVPLSQAVLLDINPPERHSRAMAVWAMGVTLGPILGPALGGWLTENYNWRWVFYINVPFGILAFLGIAASLPASLLHKSRFDFFGFFALSIAVIGMQLTLDRGQLKDWFASPEIWIEATIAVVAFYLFLVHIFTTRGSSFVSLSLFKDRNFLTGSVFIFIVGVVLFATLALLPPMLQGLLNYSVLATGWVTAPRGAGTLAGMFLVGQIGNKIDARILIAAGLGLTSLSLWQMTGFDLQMDERAVAVTGFVQGIGTGLAYVPLAAATFATLTPALRNEGTALFSLIRNLGSSVGISVVETLLTRNTQTLHAQLAERVTRFNPAVQTQLAGGASQSEVISRLNAEVTQQAAMIAYNNDFKFMLVMTLAAIPFLALLRRARRGAATVLIE